MSGLRVRGEAMGDTKGSEDEPASSMDMTMGFMSMLDSVEAGEGKTDSATRGGEEEGKEGKTETASPAAGKSAGKPVPQASMTLMSQFLHAVTVSYDFDLGISLADEILETEPDNSMIQQYIPVLKAMKAKFEAEKAAAEGAGSDTSSADGDSDGSDTDHEGSDEDSESDVDSAPSGPVVWGAAGAEAEAALAGIASGGAAGGAGGAGSTERKESEDGKSGD